MQLNFFNLNFLKINFKKHISKMKFKSNGIQIL